MADSIMNFVGQLQEMCQTAHIAIPEYNDESTEKLFKFSCKLKGRVCHGTGGSKKVAKHNSAKEMLNQIEEGKLSLGENDGSFKKSSVSKLLEYCQKKRVENPEFVMPLFKELPIENNIFHCQYSLGDFTAVGEGSSKKEAKEKAASKVVKQFGINEFFDNLKTAKERQKALSPLYELHLFCLKKQLSPPRYEECECTNDRFKMTCHVGEVEVESSFLNSKKAAKFEAATLALQYLKMNTPITSPSRENEEMDRSSLKRKISTESSSSEELVMEPLVKRVQ